MANSSFIPTGEPDIRDADAAVVLECLKSGWVSGEGPYVRQFEEAFAGRVGRKYGIAVANGSAALEAAFQSLGLKPGDEVIMPTFTIIACAAAILRAGGKPVTVDCDPVTWTMRPNEVEQAIGSRTRAILLVHIYGMPVDAEPILAMAKRRDLFVVEDSAEAIGQTYRGRPCGALGDISTFSFYANKNVTTGEGGMVLTDDGGLASRIRSLRQLSHPDARRFRHYELSWNWKMSNLQAALGCAQLERLAETCLHKRRVGEWYQSRLVELDAIQRPVTETCYAHNDYWAYGVVLTDSVQSDVGEIMGKLQRRGIGTQAFFWPMHEQPALQKCGLFTGVSHPNAERIARRGFYLPSSSRLSEAQVDRVCAALCEAL